MSEPLLKYSGIILLVLVAVYGAALIAQPPQEASIQDHPLPTFKAEANEVLVPVVVTDTEGRSVGGLKQENFEILDNGKPEVITGFDVIERESESSSGPASARAHDSPEAPQATTVGRRYILLVFDDLNLSSSDVMQSQKAGTTLFEKPLPVSDEVAVLATSGFDTGLTNDHATLQRAVLSLKSHNLYSRINEDCPNIDYYQADQIENKRDFGALEAAIDEFMSCSPIKGRGLAEEVVHQASRRAISIGDQNFRVTLNFLMSTVNKMATLPGQRVLVLISPGFLTPTDEATKLISKVLDSADKAGVTISTADARGLYTTISDITARSSGSVLQVRQQEQNRPSSMSANAEVMAALADGSGGTFFHNANDLIHGLNDLFGGPKFLYMLAFLPHEKLNGRYHVLKVKVNREGLRLRSRHGYFATKPEHHIQY
jgi:VWFA-related protein